MGYEKLQPSGLAERELNEVEDLLANQQTDATRRILLVSGHWHGAHPRQDLTNRWNHKFYCSFYPGLDPSDGAYRVLGRLDGNVWLGLQRLAYWLPAQDYDHNHGRENEEVPYYVEQVQKGVEGQQPSTLNTELQLKMRENPIVFARVLTGMPRTLRMFSAMIGRVALEPLERTPKHLEVIKDALNLTDIENQVTQNIFTTVTRGEL